MQLLVRYGHWWRRWYSGRIVLVVGVAAMAVTFGFRAGATFGLVVLAIALAWIVPPVVGLLVGRFRPVS
jgi:hypothetical protein